MSKKTRRMVRTGLALAATTIAQVALEEAAENPRIQRKAKAIVASAGRTLKRTIKKVSGKRTAARRKE